MKAERDKRKKLEEASKEQDEKIKKLNEQVRKSANALVQAGIPWEQALEMLG